MHYGCTVFHRAQVFPATAFRCNNTFVQNVAINTRDLKENRTCKCFVYLKRVVQELLDFLLMSNMVQRRRFHGGLHLFEGHTAASSNISVDNIMHMKHSHY